MLSRKAHPVRGGTSCTFSAAAPADSRQLSSEKVKWEPLPGWALPRRLDLRKELRHTLDLLATGTRAEIAKLSRFLGERCEQLVAGLGQVGSEEQGRHPQALD